MHALIEGALHSIIRRPGPRGIRSGGLLISWPPEALFFSVERETMWEVVCVCVEERVEGWEEEERRR